jgi:hypothetical protein
MVRKHLALIAALCGAFLSMAGCGNSNPTMSDTSHTYVISSLSLPAMTGTTSAVGFNLDGVNSTGTCPTEPCTCVELAPDFVSADDPNETGIDNSLSILVPTIETLLTDGTSLDETLLQQIANGELLIMLGVSEINSYQDDSEVEVQFYTGAVPEGATIEVDGSMLAPDQIFDATPVGSPIMGNIVGGRLVFSAPLVMIPINAGGFVLDLQLRSATFEANISPDRLVAGVIGGSVNIEEVADAVEAAMPGLRDTVLEVLGGNADMVPDATDMEMCTALSAGMRFGAISAEVSGN